MKIVVLTDFCCCCVDDRIGCYDNISSANVTDLSETDPTKIRSCVDYCATLGHTFAAIQVHGIRDQGYNE